MNPVRRRSPIRDLIEKRYLVTQQQQEQLQKNLASLPADERLLLLRSEHGLWLDEVAGLSGLGDGQRVHRKLTAVLKKLRCLMS